jgi:hypothetical protein
LPHSFVKLASSLALCGIFLVAAFSTLSTISFAVSPSAPNFSTPVNLSNDGGNAEHPNVQNNGSNVYVSWTEEGRGIYFRQSPNGGLTWNPPLSSTALKLSPGGGVASYPLMADYGTNVYVVWSQTTGSSEPAQIYLAASTNNGLSFSSPILVDSDPGVAQLTPVIAAYGTTVYVAWSQNSASFVASSTNNGTSFGGATEYSFQHEPQLAASGSHGYAIADGNVIYVTSNNGSTWNEVQIRGCCSSEPWIMASGPNVVAAWEGKGTSSQIYEASSQNYGQTWSTSEQILSGSLNDSWAPMVGIEGNNVVIAWRTNPGGSLSQEYVTTSTDGGVSWSAPLSIGILNRDNAWPFTVTLSGDNAYVMWSEKLSANSSSTDWQTLVDYGAFNGTAWNWSSPPTSLTGNSNPAFGAQAEQDIATGAISSSSAQAYSVWQNNATKSQIYFAAS